MAEWSVPGVPSNRIRIVNAAPIRPDRRHVLYWMTAFRRLHSNFALDRAIEHARTIDRPLIILEALRVDYPWASDRLHRFVIDGMAGHAATLADGPVAYFPFVEPRRRASRGLLAALALEACVVVTDDYPCFFLPRMLKAAATTVAARMEAVDSNGILPIRAAARTFVTARSFRSHMQRHFTDAIAEWPAMVAFKPLRPATIPRRVARRWRPTPVSQLRKPDALLASLPIDHSVGHAVGHSVSPSEIRGGSAAGRAALRAFIENGLTRYAKDQRHPDADGTSGLSPYLHFGHVSAHEVFEAVMSRERWTSRRLAPTAHGQRAGWWGVSPDAEAFLDQLITWRELGFNMCASQPNAYGSYRSLPAWARRTLAKHARDRRTRTYSRAQLARAETHDDVWNAAQRQLVRSGWMHNYLRMLWGKKILEWTPTPQTALAVMAELMNRFALDGRDPNSYSGYAWVLGRYDRAWGPERPIFGTVRYMSSAATRRKLRMRGYLKRWSK
jgi:deoxyribodipyrimidine photo-lyase